MFRWNWQILKYLKDHICILLAFKILWKVDHLSCRTNITFSRMFPKVDSIYTALSEIQNANLGGKQVDSLPSSCDFNPWMLGNFLKIEFKCCLLSKTWNYACFWRAMIHWVANRLDLSPAELPGWPEIQPVCHSVYPFPAHQELKSVNDLCKQFGSRWSPTKNVISFQIIIVWHSDCLSTKYSQTHNFFIRKR